MVAFSNFTKAPKTHSYPNTGWRKFPPPPPLFCCKELALEVCPSILDTICIYLKIIACIIIIIISSSSSSSSSSSISSTAIEFSLGDRSPYTSRDKTNKNNCT